MEEKDIFVYAVPYEDLHGSISVVSNVGSMLVIRLSYKRETYIAAFIGLLQTANLPMPLGPMNSENNTDMPLLNFDWRV